MTRGERVFARLLRCYPRDFRERYTDDLLAFFRQDRDHPRYGSGPMRPIRFWIATIRDLVRSAWRQRTGASGGTAPAPRRSGSWPGRLRADVLHGWRGLR